MTATVEIDQGFLRFLAPPCGIDERRGLTAGLVAAGGALGERYRLLRERPDPAALLVLGRDLHAWLDGQEGWMRRLLRVVTADLAFEVRSLAQPDAAAWAVLNAPWELLAGERGFLAED